MLKKFQNKNYTSDFLKNLLLCNTLIAREGITLKQDEVLLAKYWGEQITSLRRERGMTQAQLAQEVRTNAKFWHEKLSVT